MELDPSPFDLRRLSACLSSEVRREALKMRRCPR
jgi:hypothetical protein